MRSLIQVPLLGICLLLLSSSSSSPVVAEYEGKELDFRGPTGYLFDSCEGHCSYDWQCTGWLRCYKRHGDLIPVPGCSGVGIPSVDYCFDPDNLYLNSEDMNIEDMAWSKSENSEDMEIDDSESEENKLSSEDLLKSAKNGVVPDSSSVIYLGTNVDLKLGKCQGKCNSDVHCRDGLDCFNLPGQTYVPGCGHREDTSISICFDKREEIEWESIPEDSETLLFVGKVRDKNYKTQFGRCIGDCRVDADCKGDLECYEEEGSSVPGCLGVRVNLATENLGYCHDPNSLKSSYKLNFVASSPEYLLDHCEGHCASDNDCGGGLACYDDPDSAKVPGCPGRRLTGVSYCVLPDDWPEYSPPTATPTDAIQTEVLAADQDIILGDPNNTDAEELEVADDLNESEYSIEEDIDNETIEETNDSEGETNEATNVAPEAVSKVEPTEVEQIEEKITTQNEEYRPSKISIPLPAIHARLSFESFQHARRLGSTRIHENIEEQGELMAIFAGLLGEGIRRLGPRSFSGMLLDISFVDEKKWDDGTTTVTYRFEGDTMFRNNEDFVQPTQRLVTAAALESLNKDVIVNALAQSGDPVLETVQDVSVFLPYTGAETNVGVKEEAESSNSSVKKALIAVLVVVILVCCGLAIYFNFKRKNRNNLWKAKGVGTHDANVSDDGTPPTAPSSPSKKDDAAIFASPTRTKETEIDSAPCTPEIHVPDVHVNTAMPDESVGDNVSDIYDEQSSAGATSVGGESNWSFAGRMSSYGVGRVPSEIDGNSVNSGHVGGDAPRYSALANVLKFRGDDPITEDGADNEFERVWTEKEDESFDVVLGLEPVRSSLPNYDHIYP